MKKIILPFLMAGYLFWGIACTHNHHEAEHDHAHTGDSEHSHEEQEHSRLAEGHDHDDEDHEHEGEEQYPEAEHQHDEGAHQHDEGAHQHDEGTHQHDAEPHQDNEGEYAHDLQYGIVELQPKTFREVIHTSGKIMPAQGDEITLTAVHDGVVVFGKKALMSGEKIREGEKLITISGKGLIHDNIETTFMDSKSAFETAKANYERAKLLNEDKITSDRELAEIKMAYEKAKNSYEIVRKNYSAGGQKVAASNSGFIKNVFVTEGQFVTTGQPLLKITKNKRLVVKADVPQRYFPMLSRIKTANFVTTYDKKLHKTNELNGKLISYGKSTGDNSLFTPIYFEIDNVGNLLAGSFVEVYLKTVEIPNAIVVPRSALLEEAGRYYVFAEEGESFEKHYVTIDCNDGENYHIIDGLHAGDHVATKNPYLIKLASMSSALPAHSHQH
ncbi:efflux RND transporter periplasmic adaptor subunit [Sunxiuqinia indica]|uniref:efflux RND transporter periplasmic adaptor subunit n=1 Tax=Sunxiuqinia indica TaxID=2692584 RepID=UPI00135C3210|nr:efflux RND transporter periplasmic adaptor subunit [Sunxiuqinia indica]